MEQICANNLCTGCGSCIKSCARTALTMSLDNEGFLRPVIDQHKCIDCGLCRKICPQNEPVALHAPAAHALGAWAADRKIRRNSSSGGIFPLLAEAVLRENGIVCGCALIGEDLQPEHILIDNIDDLPRLCGSKYVQSDASEAYEKITLALKNHRKVLFCGTPCQTAALRKFVGSSDDNLITIDLVCHGVPSRKLYNKYLQWQSRKAGKAIRNVFFRYKHFSWYFFRMRVNFEGKTIETPATEDPMFIGFIRNLAMQTACSTCRYCRPERVGDITLADFWGFSTFSIFKRPVDRGVSLVLLNTEKGKQLYKTIENQTVTVVKPLSMAVQGNPCLSRPFALHEKRNDFLQKLDSEPFEDLIEEFLQPDPQKFRWQRTIFGSLFVPLLPDLFWRFKRIVLLICRMKNPFSKDSENE